MSTQMDPYYSPISPQNPAQLLLPEVFTNAPFCLRPNSELLGEGSFGAVRKVYRSGEAKGQDYAEKFVDNKKDVEIKMLKREAYIMHFLTNKQIHPHIVQFVEFWKKTDRNNDKEHHLVMEPCCAGSLGQWLQPSRSFKNLQSPLVPQPLALRWMQEISSAVAFLHHHQLIHGDLSTNNILVLSVDVPTVFLCDFGTARRFGSEGSAKSLTGFTKWFRAPELGVDGKQRRATDVWAIGCIFVQILWRSNVNLPIKKLLKRRVDDPNCGGFLAELPVANADTSVIANVIKRIAVDRVRAVLFGMLKKATNKRPTMDNVLSELLKTNVPQQPVPTEKLHQLEMQRSDKILVFKEEQRRLEEEQQRINKEQQTLRQNHTESMATMQKQIQAERDMEARAALTLSTVSASTLTLPTVADNCDRVEQAEDEESSDEQTEPGDEQYNRQSSSLELMDVSEQDDDYGSIAGDQHMQEEESSQDVSLRSDYDSDDALY